MTLPDLSTLPVVGGPQVPYIDPTQFIGNGNGFTFRGVSKPVWRQCIASRAAAALRGAIGVTYNGLSPGSQADADLAVGELAACGFKRMRIEYPWGLLSPPGPGGAFNNNIGKMLATACNTQGVIPLILLTMNGAPTPSSFGPPGSTGYASTFSSWSTFVLQALNEVSQAMGNSTNFDVEILNEGWPSWLNLFNGPLFPDQFSSNVPTVASGTVLQFVIDTGALISAHFPGVRLIWGVTNTSFIKDGPYCSNVVAAGFSGFSLHPYGVYPQNIPQLNTQAINVEDQLPDFTGALGHAAGFQATLAHYESYTNELLLPSKRALQPAGFEFFMTEHGFEPGAFGILATAAARESKAKFLTTVYPLLVGLGIQSVWTYSAAAGGELSFQILDANNRVTEAGAALRRMVNLIASAQPAASVPQLGIGVTLLGSSDPALWVGNRRETVYTDSAIALQAGSPGQVIDGAAGLPVLPAGSHVQITGPNVDSSDNRWHQVVNSTPAVLTVDVINVAKPAGFPVTVYQGTNSVYLRDQVAVLPFQVNPKRWVIFLVVLDYQAFVEDVPPIAIELAIAGLPSNLTAAAVYDPVQDAAVPSLVRSQGTGTFSLRTWVTPWARALVVDLS